MRKKSSRDPKGYFLDRADAAKALGTLESQESVNLLASIFKKARESNEQALAEGAARGLAQLKLQGPQKELVEYLLARFKTTDEPQEYGLLIGNLGASAELALRPWMKWRPTDQMIDEMPLVPLQQAFEMG